MKELRQMKPRDLQEEIKRGSGIWALSQKYNATEEEIEKHIRRLYNQSESKANDIFNELARNDKFAKKKQRVLVVAEEEVCADIIAIEEEEEFVIEDITGMTPDLDKMQEQHEALRAEVIALEEEHKDLMNRRANLKDDTRGLTTRLAEMRRQIVEIGKEYRTKAKEFNQIGKEMVTISERRSIKVGQLDELKARISQLQTIELFVYDDGEIVAENRPDITLDMSGYEDSYDTLLHADEDFLDLKKSQLMTLARLNCAIENLGSNANFELTFDDEEIEIAYYNLHTA